MCVRRGSNPEVERIHFEAMNAEECGPSTPEDLS